MIGKTCGCCGRTHSDNEWQRLPNRRVWHFDQHLTQEVRDCVCGSTIGVPITLSEVLLGRNVSHIWQERLAA